MAFLLVPDANAVVLRFVGLHEPAIYLQWASRCHQGLVVWLSVRLLSGGTRGGPAFGLPMLRGPVVPHGACREARASVRACDGRGGCMPTWALFTATASATVTTRLRFRPWVEPSVFGPASFIRGSCAGCGALSRSRRIRATCDIVTSRKRRRPQLAGCVCVCVCVSVSV